jgi:hypothetical protein
MRISIGMPHPLLCSLLSETRDRADRGRGAMPVREVDVLLWAARQTIDARDNHILRRIVNSDRGDPRFIQGGTCMAVWDDVIGDTEAFFGTPLVSYLAPALRAAGGVAR